MMTGVDLSYSSAGTLVGTDNREVLKKIVYGNTLEKSSVAVQHSS